jgi:UDP-N-acetylglucosamine acyltransferase
MSNNIHPTAIIEDTAEIGENVSIGPYCTIGAKSKIKDGVTLHSHVCIQGDTEIGEGSEIFPFASIGFAPQDLKFKGEHSRLIIGKNNLIREHVTMNPGTEGGGLVTKVGDNCLFMVGSHIAHDCMIGDNVIMANNATLGGHVVVGDYAVIGGMSAVHQFIRIGKFAVIGGMSGVDSDVIPYGRVKGERAFLAGLNLTGLERGGFDKEQIKKLQKAFKSLFSEEGTMEQRLENIEVNYAQDELIQSIIEFARNKDRFPLCQPQKKAA